MSGRVAGDVEHQLAGQRIAVGVQSGGGQADEHVAHLHVFAGEDLFALDGADDEAGEVVFALGIEAGHLGGFAADEGAAVVLAGLGQSADDFLGDLQFELAHGEVVHEEQRRGALHGDVIDAVVHQVAAHGVVHAHFKGELELGAHAIDAADQHRVGEFFLVHLEEPAKAADLAQDALVEGAVRQVLDALLGAVCLLDVHACIGVGEALLLCVVSQGRHVRRKVFGGSANQDCNIGGGKMR